MFYSKSRNAKRFEIFLFTIHYFFPTIFGEYKCLEMLYVMDVESAFSEALFGWWCREERRVMGGRRPPPKVTRRWKLPSSTSYTMFHRNEQSPNFQYVLYLRASTVRKISKS